MQINEIGDNNIYTGREVKRMLRELLEGTGDIAVTTVDASQLLGHSPDWWRRAAPSIPGALQGANGGPWTLPLRACREHVAQLQERGKLRRRHAGQRQTTPWKGRTAPQIVSAL